MPIATIDPQEDHRYDLKTLEGGFVTIKRLSYGDWLTRQQLAISIQLSGKPDDQGGTIEMTNRAVAEWEFKQCVVDHNLTDANEVALDFNSKQALAMLNPRVGTEIAGYIAKLHDFEPELPN